ncbi:MAG: VOC family protein [Clostridia bacterium]|nr:VOC family protein [Clostridia bacterium]
MKFNSIHHIAIIGSDYSKSKEFYHDILGFEIIRENYRPERDDYKIDMKLGDSELELFIIKDRPERPDYPEAYGLRHLALKVDDIESVVAELELFGIECESIRTDDYTGERMTFFKDPNGLPIELHE